MNVVNVIRMLEEELETWYPHPTCKWRLEKAKLISYRRWAMESIIDWVWRNRENPPIIVMEEFLQMMDDAACEATEMDQNIMFSTAYDVAMDVYDMLRRSD